MKKEDMIKRPVGMVFGDSTVYKKKGDRCSCKCHSPKNKLSCCKNCEDELWPGELCAIENYDESKTVRFDNAEDAIKYLIRKTL
ncbi:MAG: hypothetical protein EPO63_01870 [Candidatus Nitrosotenuis sp.]|nr:MAG: hypothetical protein EPO63_01870 [Candidatus Nitrosotenuis sp.]